MIGLDTNVLLRYFAQDDERQSPLADAIIASLTPDEPGWISVATILEFVWATGRKMRVDKILVCNIIDRLLMLDTILLEQETVIAAAAHRFRTTSADFADCLIAESSFVAGCSRIFTFDRIAARDAGMYLAE